MNNRNKRAFSLIEVLIAIAIVALAASLVYPIVRGNKDRAAYQISMVNLGAVSKAMERHYLETGKYPVFSNWDELSAEASPLLEYVNEIPKTDGFGRAYNIKESNEEGYTLEGFAASGKLKKECPDYAYSTGQKFKKGKKGK